MSAAKPMGSERRIAAYTADRADMTRRQVRRLNQKANRALRVGPRELTPRQVRWAGIRKARAERRASR